jgi:hypothetical protein
MQGRHDRQQALGLGFRRPRLQRQVTENPIARRVSHRFVAGEQLDEALEDAADLVRVELGQQPRSRRMPRGRRPDPGS